eukprot:CAMPEP_0116004724 /NCGR_PEP_ID=MMETSP0321-20121206/763_1 /TAXON_ID=163516 /ORGANISM="Leptocylindrus danicus var. danicus, Strain B650" /LENGTH=648 /DNA_ID=CAMNT_0003473061 /DNA_START=61 /DNA_END=2007 /DNA_ORIENTATION=-
MGPPKKKQKRQKNKHIDPQILSTRRQIQMCAKNQDLRQALSVYEEAISKNIKIECQTFHCLLSLCSMTDGSTASAAGNRQQRVPYARRLHVGTPRDQEKSLPSKDDANDEETNGEEKALVPVAERKEYAYQIKQKMDDFHLRLNESGYTVLIRLLCASSDEADNAIESSSSSATKDVDTEKANGINDETGGAGSTEMPVTLLSNTDLDKARDLLAEAESSKDIKLKLRLYAPLIYSVCKRRDVSGAFTLWEQASKHNDIALSELEYLYIMQCATEVGDAVVFDRVLANVAEDILVPSKVLARAIIEWFESKAAIKSEDNDQKSSTGWNFGAIPNADAAPSLGPVVCSNQWNIDLKCKVDAKTGCLLNGCMKDMTLKPVPLTSEAWQSLMEMNEAIVRKGSLENDTSEFQGGRKGKKRSVEDLSKRVSKWEMFGKWLTKHAGPIHSNGFDVIIDGANVGYYETNFAGAPKHVDYNQIDGMIRHFEDLGKKVLVVLHERHFFSKLVPRSADKIIERWNENKLVFRTPYDSNDDWYWFHAALYSGMDTLVVTNDEMRDHHFQMLAHRSFLRWKERHQIRFHFGSWISTGDTRHRAIELSFPRVYSRRIQRLADGLVIPLPKKGDENRFLDGEHVASTEPVEEAYICIKSSK